MDDPSVLNIKKYISSMNEVLSPLCPETLEKLSFYGELQPNIFLNNYKKHFVRQRYIYV